ncbi:hypothetical protein DESC_870036 [Desulfosarcina cetonica]|nr:hypothetical protein DESC_870036 [Desulfosarcina cetonica]
MGQMVGHNVQVLTVGNRPGHGFENIDVDSVFRRHDPLLSGGNADGDPAQGRYDPGVDAAGKKLGNFTTASAKHQDVASGRLIDNLFGRTFNPFFKHTGNGFSIETALHEQSGNPPQGLLLLGKFRCQVIHAAAHFRVFRVGGIVDGRQRRVRVEDRDGRPFATAEGIDGKTDALLVVGGIIVGQQNPKRCHGALLSCIRG